MITIHPTPHPPTHTHTSTADSYSAEGDLSLSSLQVAGIDVTVLCWDSLQEKVKQSLRVTQELVVVSVSNNCVVQCQNWARPLSWPDHL